jgi:hypothetical protein
MPPWRNKYLLYAIALSMSLHLMILYIPMFNVSLIIYFYQINNVILLDCISNLSTLIRRMVGCYQNLITSHIIG